LIKFIEEGPEEVRFAAIRATGGIGRAAAAALPGLYATMKTPNPELRIQALQALGHVEPDDDKLLPIVLKALTDGGGVRRVAVVSLRRFGDKALPAVPALVEMLAREGDRASALTTLRGITIHDIEMLTSKLEDKTPAVRSFACEALGKLGPEAGAALPALQLRAQYEGEPVRGVALKAIQQIKGGK
ncbi:MAG: putative lyase, partial [Verrucomicrobia bacterium]|nr:putative lyase [Verrucomicrobiota bacterium]